MTVHVDTTLAQYSDWAFTSSVVVLVVALLLLAVELAYNSAVPLGEWDGGRVFSNVRERHFAPDRYSEHHRAQSGQRLRRTWKRQASSPVE